MILVASFLFMAITTALTLFIMKHFAAVPCKVGLAEQGIFIRLMQRTPLYPKAALESNWSNIVHVSSYLDPNHNKRFYVIRFKQPAITVSLMAPENSFPNDEDTLFGVSLQHYVDGYNAGHTAESSAPISNKGFYDSWWAKTPHIPCMYNEPACDHTEVYPARPHKHLEIVAGPDYFRDVACRLVLQYQKVVRKATR